MFDLNLFQKCDTSSASLVFVCQDSSLLADWLTALTPNFNVGSRKIPKRCALPSVQEED